jgi:multidrug resistance protein MdtO
VRTGVGVATFVQMSFWREGESDVLRQKLATILRAIAAQLHAPQVGAGSHDELPYAQRQLQAWALLADTEATLSRVALEPGWQEGEQVHLTLRAQTVLAQAREIMLGGDALRNALAAQAGSSSPQVVDAMRSMQELATVELGRYADGLAAEQPVAHAPAVLAPHRAGIVAQTPGPADVALNAAADELLRQVAALPDWRVERPAGVSPSEAIRT